MLEEVLRTPMDFLRRHQERKRAAAITIQQVESLISSITMDHNLNHTNNSQQRKHISRHQQGPPVAMEESITLPTIAYHRVNIVLHLHPPPLLLYRLWDKIVVTTSEITTVPQPPLPTQCGR